MKEIEEAREWLKRFDSGVNESLSDSLDEVVTLLRLILKEIPGEDAS